MNALAMRCLEYSALNFHIYVLKNVCPKLTRGMMYELLAKKILYYINETVTQILLDISSDLL